MHDFKLVRCTTLANLSLGIENFKRDSGHSTKRLVKCTTLISREYWFTCRKLLLGSRKLPLGGQSLIISAKVKVTMLPVGFY